MLCRGDILPVRDDRHFSKRLIHQESRFALCSNIAGLVTLAEVSANFLSLTSLIPVIGRVAGIHISQHLCPSVSSHSKCADYEMFELTDVFVLGLTE